MKTYSIHKQFEVLVGLRDGNLTHIEQLTTTQSLHKIVRFALHLDSHGIAKFNCSTGELTPVKTFFDSLNALDISLSQLQEYEWSSVIANPIFHQILKIGIEHDVFVLMPFSSDLLPLYEDHLRIIIDDMGYSCARADDFFTTESIIEDIWTAIRNAKVIVADCTGRNPNVFYEIGIAHTLGKPVVLLSQNVDDLPFDLRHRRTIIYHYTPRGMKEFENVFRRTIESAIGSKHDGARKVKDWKRWIEEV